MAIEETNTTKPALMSLESFLKEWDKKYMEEISKIPLFNSNMTEKWTKKQKEYFIKVFYHARGHFHDFLWHIGNHAPNLKIKEIVLKNLSEEFGQNKKSHEQLYLDFANSAGVDLNHEIIEGKAYLPFVKSFNTGHLKWLNQHDWESDFCAFSAYERLDNIDYPQLLNLIKSFKDNLNLVFFEAHTKVEHFEETLDLLEISYQINPHKVKEAYHFIGNHQVEMWKNLSKTIFEYVEK